MTARSVRDDLGKLVRDTWVAWALRQPSAKASWPVPWEVLAEHEKEVDREIGEAIERTVLQAVRSGCEALRESEPMGGRGSDWVDGYLYALAQVDEALAGRLGL